MQCQNTSCTGKCPCKVELNHIRSYGSILGKGSLPLYRSYLKTKASGYEVKRSFWGLLEVGDSKIKLKNHNHYGFYAFWKVKQRDVLFQICTFNPCTCWIYHSFSLPSAQVKPFFSWMCRMGAFSFASLTVELINQPSLGRHWRSLSCWPRLPFFFLKKPM